MTHCRYYQIAEITLKIESDLPINDQTFAPKFSPDYSRKVLKRGKDIC
jgi:hypothetical protein